MSDKIKWYYGVQNENKPENAGYIEAKLTDNLCH